MERSYLMGKQELNALPDGELIRRAQRGEREAFEAVYERYHSRLYRLLYGMLGNPADAADLTQEAFVRAYDKLDQLQSDGHMYGWLRRTAVNLGIDMIRRRQTVRFESLDQPFENEEGGSMAMEVEDQSASPLEELESKTLQAAVLEAMATLTPDHRAVVAMHYLEDMSVDDVAKLLEVPPGTVKSRLSRARDAMRRYLSDYVEG